LTLFARNAYKQGILDVKFLSNLSKKCKVIKNHNMSIKKAIELLKNESFTIETIVPYLRELFDDYRISGGEPKKWLSGMLNEINDNSHS
jgi:hypothetical protein